MNFEQILLFFHNQNGFIIYGIVMAAAFTENLFPPFPGDSVTIAGAFVAGEGNTSYIGVLISAIAGGLAGALLLYYIGRVKGRKYFRNSRYFGAPALAKVESWFARFGALILIISRFIFGVRSAVAVAAGLGDVRLARMTSLTLLSFIMWNGLILSLVFYTKANWDTISDIGRKYNYILIVGLATLTLIGIARWLWRKKQH
jgi:membrane protein DedA with SNARE-associated domain